MKKISTDIAYRIRFYRGLELPTGVNYQYEDERVQEIAVEEKHLTEMLDKLDRELKEIFMACVLSK